MILLVNEEPLGSERVNPFTAVSAHKAIIDFTLSNARRFYSSMENPLAVKGLWLFFFAVCYVCEIPLKDSQMSEKQKRLASPAKLPHLYTQGITGLDLVATLEAASTMGSRLSFPVLPLLHFFS